MNRHEKMLQRLMTLAEDTNTERAKHAAALVINNNVISFGMNQSRTEPLQYQFSRNHRPLATCVHAEVDAIKNAIKRVGISALRRSTLYISRVRRSSQRGPFISANSKPCRACQNAIDAFEIKRVVYTVDGDDGEMTYEVVQRAS